MTTIYILLGIIVLFLIRIWETARRNAVRLQDISPKIHFIYEQLLKEKIQRENEDSSKKILEQYESYMSKK